MSVSEKLEFLPPELMRPALLGDVRPPAILLPTGKYGAPFLIVGDESAPDAIFLDGQYKFQTFKRGTNEHWSGLAIENIEFELNTKFAVELPTWRKQPGMLIRKSDQLMFVAIAEGPFSRITEVPLRAGLPQATEDQETGFLQWRAVSLVGQKSVCVWQAEVERPKDAS